ncbi:MAG TPA: sigma-70 family RNA polymerase sigma factor, partial [Sedimentisphaerales bacterium]|nr:sigma-70 family RNA polymerase sigma factor [Sedimentisphaerales bacterium]
MFHSSGKPNKANRFWPRLLDAALNKLRIGRGKEQYPNPETLSLSNMGDEDAQDAGQQVLADAVSRELKDIIFSAMRRLKPRHRAVLTLRCYRNMEYEHIAHCLQCSEFAAKVQFYRAKHVLQKQLSRHGFGGGAFLAAMVLFGKITAPSEAAAKTLAISAATTKVGVAAGLAAVATSKAAILSLAAASAISVGAVAVMSTSGPDQPTASLIDGSTISSQITADIPQASPGIHEYWHYYPEGTKGPVMMRLLKWDSRAKQPYCQWLQNEHANYLFDGDKNTVFIRNHHIWHSDGAVWRLPTDNSVIRK